MCGLLWTLILRFTIADINVEGLTAKEGLLLWCQRKTLDYADVDVRNFTSSWTDGLAFCALLHRYRPDLLDYAKLDKKDHKGNMELVFRLADEHIGISRLLEVEDVCDVAKPDERSVMTYIAQYFHAFSHLDKVETAGRRVEKFADTMHTAWTMQTDYEVRMRSLYDAIDMQLLTWQMASFTGAYDDAKQQSVAFAEFKNGLKREWIREKLALESLLGNVQTKLKTYGLKSYSPPKGFALSDLDAHWQQLLQAEAHRSKQINSRIRESVLLSRSNDCYADQIRIKEHLRKSFAQQANDFAKMLQTLSLELSHLEGDLEDQLETASHLVEHLEPLQYVLAELKGASDACLEANIEENDHTIYSFEDMEYEFKLARSSIQKKHKFITNQIVARSKSNVTPGQLEEIDSVFRHFDKSGTNTLQGSSEFPAALASLGFTFDDYELEKILGEIGLSDGSVDWESFLNFMLEELEDQNTPEQVLNAFRDVAYGKPYVTELDLRESLIPELAVDFLMFNMPKAAEHEREEQIADEGDCFDYISYMANLIHFER